jgi:hypothetical protein
MLRKRWITKVEIRIDAEERAPKQQGIELKAANIE